jgi:hypothetical protein
MNGIEGISLIETGITHGNKSGNNHACKLPSNQAPVITHGNKSGN